MQAGVHRRSSVVRSKSAVDTAYDTSGASGSGKRTRAQSIDKTANAKIRASKKKSSGNNGNKTNSNEGDDDEDDDDDEDEDGRGGFAKDTKYDENTNAGASRSDSTSSSNTKTNDSTTSSSNNDEQDKIDEENEDEEGDEDDEDADSSGSHTSDNYDSDVSGSAPELSHKYYNSRQPEEYWNYENLKLQLSSPERYEIISRVGRGKYSDVFKAIDMQTNELRIVKVLKPVRSVKIRREIKILNNLAGGINVIKLFDVVCDPDSLVISMVFEYLSETDFRSIVPQLTPSDVQYYMFELLRGLEYCNSRGIMHRDIKPHNLVVHHPTRRLCIIDWGLAEFYHPSVLNNVRVASRYYKAPELLIDFRDYDYSVDMWAFGCVFGALIFKREHLFAGSDLYDQLFKITEALGSDALFAYLAKCKKPLVAKYPSAIRNCAGKPWKHFVKPEARAYATPEALSLLEQVLLFDHEMRLTPLEAMQHPYFADLVARRKQWHEEVKENQCDAEKLTASSTSTKKPKSKKRSKLSESLLYLDPEPVEYYLSKTQ